MERGFYGSRYEARKSGYNCVNYNYSKRNDSIGSSFDALLAG